MFPIALLPRALPWAKESGAVGTIEKLTFQEEFRMFLTKCEIQYDERYLWD
jgi:hypothetical protein